MFVNYVLAFLEEIFQRPSSKTEVKKKSLSSSSIVLVEKVQ